MDREVGALLDSLEQRQVLDGTVVVIASDHGEGFGEHGLRGHGNSLYRTELHVPLIIRYPSRVPAGTRVREVVTLRDLAATLIDLAGVDARGTLPGVSLTRVWTGAAAVRSEAISELNDPDKTTRQPVSRRVMRSLIDDTAHYIRNGDGIEQLYAWHGDPGEMRNLAREDSARTELARLRFRLNAALGKR